MTTDLKSDLKRLSGLAYHRGEWGQGLVRRNLSPPKSRKPAPGLSPSRNDIPLAVCADHALACGFGRGCKLCGVEGRDRAAARRQNEAAACLAGRTAIPLGSSGRCTACAPGTSGRVWVSASVRLQIRHCGIAAPAASRFQRGVGFDKAAFDVSKFRDHKKIIRRRMVQERNFRYYFHFGWNRNTGRFYEVFDVFCHRWNLYGMQEDRPLLLKLTVNLTPFGTIIFVPAYWSFDPKRDLKWRTITVLHRARGVARQGPKLSLNQSIRHEEGEKAARLWDQATAAGRKGDARVYWVMGKLGWDLRTDRSRLSRLLQERR